MSKDMLELQIAATPVRSHIPKDRPLVDRLKISMLYVIEHESELFWMVGNANDDMKFRTALVAVMLDGSDEDRDIIERSLLPLKMLSAATSGIPVDFAALDLDERTIPLMKLWHDIAEGKS